MAKESRKIIEVSLLLLEISLIFTLFFFTGSTVKAAIGNPNATVITWLDIGNVYPDILNVSINGETPIVLTPNETTIVSCVAVLRDYNGDADIVGVNATFYDSVEATVDSSDDNNDHYTNSSCDLIADTGGFNGFVDDPYHSIANCTFEIEYYANANDWVCSVTVNDSMAWTDTKWNTEAISPLLALGVPDIINYSTVNATFVSDEQLANITNLGNTQINLSLEGYGVTQGDGLAMNCTLGNVGTISIENEKYNLTAATAGDLTLAQTENFYENLTTTPVVRTLELASRTNDAINDAYHGTFWRIYVPRGVAGTCNGTIIFGATQGIGS